MNSGISQGKKGNNDIAGRRNISVSATGKSNRGQSRFYASPEDLADRITCSCLDLVIVYTVLRINNNFGNIIFSQ